MPGQPGHGTEPVEFVIVQHHRRGFRDHRGPRRIWKPVVELMRQGKVLWLPDDALPATSLEYLRLKFMRGSAGERMRSRRVSHKGRPGWWIWLELKEPDVVPEFEEVEEPA